MVSSENRRLNSKEFYLLITKSSFNFINKPLSNNSFLFSTFLVVSTMFLGLSSNKNQNLVISHNIRKIYSEEALSLPSSRPDSLNYSLLK